MSAFFLLFQQLPESDEDECDHCHKESDDLREFNYASFGTMHTAHVCSGCYEELKKELGQ